MSVGAKRATSLFRRVSGGRISEEIVEQMKSAIRSGELRLGDRLPSERELADLFGVSRVSVRDALRILETHGLVEIRVGARGGAFVSAPPAAVVGEGIANMLIMSEASPSDVTEARMLFENAIMPLVCERATAEDLDVLGSLCRQQEEALAEGDYAVELSARFHVALADATHNPAIQLLIESFRGPLLSSLERAKEVAPSMGRAGVREHRALVEAIRAKDVIRAQDILGRHLRRTARTLAPR